VRVRTALATLVVLTLACADDGREKPPRPPRLAAEAGAVDRPIVIATYAGSTLTADRLREQMSQLPPSSLRRMNDPERRREFVDGLILNDLLFADGDRAGHADDPDIERQVDALRRRLVVQRMMEEMRRPPDVSEEQARAYYDANPELYSGTQIRASHILVDDEAVAEQVQREAAAEPARFAELAERHSTDRRTAERGGDLGRFAPGRMLPAFERVAFKLDEGQVSEVVETAHGHHVILVTERVDGEQRPFEDVRSQIEKTLADEAVRRALETKFEALRAEADVRIDDEALEGFEPPTQGAPARRVHGH
jgi:peptidyl-prolyl cis-trans isomerase C